MNYNYNYNKNWIIITRKISSWKSKRIFLLFWVCIIYGVSIKLFHMQENRSVSRFAPNGYMLNNIKTAAILCRTVCIELASEETSVVSYETALFTWLKLKWQQCWILAGSYSKPVERFDQLVFLLSKLVKEPQFRLFT